MLKRFLLVPLLWLSLLPVNAGVDYTAYARLLKTYVDPGGVAYGAWAANAEDLAALERLMDQMARTDVASLSKAGQKAFYINLYNAAMLQAVFAHYPLTSVKEIGAPFSIFKQPRVRLGERTLSLDDIEKGILLNAYFDPRIHFAVNCASRSCPPLRAEPFVAERLEAQLEEQTRHFANSAHAARVDKTAGLIQYSELFNWYAKDFGVETPAVYLNRYRATPLNTTYRTGWIPYDWSLNTSLAK